MRFKIICSLESFPEEFPNPNRRLGAQKFRKIPDGIRTVQVRIFLYQVGQEISTDDPFF